MSKNIRMLASDFCLLMGFRWFVNVSTIYRILKLGIIVQKYLLFFTGFRGKTTDIHTDVFPFQKYYDFVSLFRNLFAFSFSILLIHTMVNMDNKFFHSLPLSVDLIDRSNNIPRNNPNPYFYNNNKSHQSIVDEVEVPK
ncbi:hypothetical protein Smp_169590 [Schistosoma mansoni]|uniref:hypothetical protein n=1 Tax=Schistosoma mansoni TaxID=6183 RepID=UPI00022DC594|nr:hypothetical protein Smp_169590 [Schistosoma mansoni]|eukprot:XP_018652177.1 hypothetical protein Smp_169590 [Schistosoma mansoni]